MVDQREHNGITFRAVEVTGACALNPVHRRVGRIRRRRNEIAERGRDRVHVEVVVWIPIELNILMLGVHITLDLKTLGKGNSVRARWKRQNHILLLSTSGEATRSRWRWRAWTGGDCDHLRSGITVAVFTPGVAVAPGGVRERRHGDHITRSEASRYGRRARQGVGRVDKGPGECGRRIELIEQDIDLGVLALETGTIYRP